MMQTDKLPFEDDALNAVIAERRATYEAHLDTPGGARTKECGAAYMALFRALDWKNSGARRIGRLYTRALDAGRPVLVSA